MKKFNLKKNQIYLIVWGVLLTGIFLYFLISNINSLIAICEDLSIWEGRAESLTGLSQSQISDITQSYKTSIIRISISFVLIGTLYISAMILLIQKLKLSIKNRIDPPTI